MMTYKKALVDRESHIVFYHIASYTIIYLIHNNFGGLYILRNSTVKNCCVV